MDTVMQQILKGQQEQLARLTAITEQLLKREEPTSPNLSTSSKNVLFEVKQPNCGIGHGDGQLRL